MNPSLSGGPPEIGTEKKRNIPEKGYGDDVVFLG